MPDNFLPVGTQGVRRNQCDHFTKTDADQRPDIGESDGTHRKILSTFEDLDDDRHLGLELVFGHQAVPAFLKQRRHVRPQDLRIARTHVYAEMLCLQRFVLFQHIKYLQHV